MSTYPSPVFLSDFQRYLKDTTTDVTIQAFYQSLLDTATEKIYTYLDRDYTPGVMKTDIFFGNGLHVHWMYNPAGILHTWKYYDAYGNETVVSISELVLLANGTVAVAAEKRFLREFEHRIVYDQPLSLICPETVRQVITEVAAVIFEESKQGASRLGIEVESDRSDSNYERARYQDLTKRQERILAPYKRMAV